MPARLLSDTEIDAVSGGIYYCPALPEDSYDSGTSIAVRGKDGESGSSNNVRSVNAVAIGIGSIVYGASGNGGPGGTAWIF